MNILITTAPFGEFDRLPLELLEQAENVNFTLNPFNRKLKEAELAEMVGDFDILIAGTEQITRKVLENGRKLKLISRVGIGLDSVDLTAARELGIAVSYTPDAPAPAVAELTIGHIFSLLRNLPTIDRETKAGRWTRMTGERLALQTVGIIGCGRIGSRVLEHLQGFYPNILVNDIAEKFDIVRKFNAECASKEEIFEKADIISVHVPLTKQTRNMISRAEIEKMKPNVKLINTARGGIINEQDLYEALKSKRISGAAMDVFEIEPYSGNLLELGNCFISCHMGSMTKDCRARMEIEATEEALRFVRGETLRGVVPEMEYENQA